MVRHALLFFLLVAIPPATVSPQEAAKHHTRVTLLADVTSIAPGSEFTVGVLMEMDPGWHTYWKNGGEAGLPTEIAWTLPPGISAGEIHWPLPNKYLEEGDVLTYGYEKQTMLLVPMKAAQGLRPGERMTLDADVSWLECERICVPGSAHVSLTLPVAATSPGKANTALFDNYRRTIPRPFNADPDVDLSFSMRASSVEIMLAARGNAQLQVQPDVSPDFYPEEIGNVVIGRTRASALGQSVTLSVPLSVIEPISGPRTLRGVLLYQVVGRERSFGEIEIPMTAEFVAGLPVEGEEPRSIIDQAFTTVQPPGVGLPLYTYIAFALLGGLLLNIMPCVLPVIALKLFGLVKMSGDHPSKVKKHGLSFSAGILASFLVLALAVILIKAAGQQVGWGFQFQEPLFIIAMSAIVFAFGLSLFGVYELGVPFLQTLTNVGSRLTTSTGRGGGYGASFSEGVFATILATPCTAPFLGTALGFAFAQPASVTILIFTSTAVGMALPYIVLTARPSWVKFLPKPGEWMVTAKQFMGFLMMGTLLWLLYVLGMQLGVEAIIWTAAFLLAIGIACWLIGRYATLSTSRRTYATTYAAALLLVAGSYWVFLETILDIRNVIAGVPTAQVSGADSKGIPWEPFSLAALDGHLRDNRTVFIDFTAEWCLTCKVNEKTVLNDSRVVEKFRSHNLVALKADWTSRNPEITQLLARFGRSGVPLYVIFPAGRPAEPIVLPEVITAGLVIDAIERAGGKVSARLPVDR